MGQFHRYVAEGAGFELGNILIWVSIFSLMIHFSCNEELTSLPTLSVGSYCVL